MGLNQINGIAVKIAAGIVVCLPTVAFGSPPEPKIALKVKFDQTFYDLELNRDLFTYKEGPRVYSVKVKGCNRAKLNQIVESYQALLKESSKQPPRAKTKYDVEITAGGKKMEVARGSDLGTWLRDMPKKIMYLHAEVQAPCKR